MYLSRVKINDTLRNSRSALANPQVMHALVAGCFDNTKERQRPLWRIDTLSATTYLLLVSLEKPDLSNLLSQLTLDDDQEAIIKEYDQFLSRIGNGDIFRFRLTANPVHSLMPKNGKSERGKIYGQVTVEQQKSWLQKRSEKNGFELIHFDVASRGERNFKRNNETVTLTVATFEGVLKVIDADALRQVLMQGLGRAKAYGCGLMTVARS